MAINYWPEHGPRCPFFRSDGIVERSPHHGQVYHTYSRFIPHAMRTASAYSAWHEGCSRQVNTFTMNNLLNIIIVLLIVGWLVGFIGFGSMVGSLIHILIVLAIIGIVYRLFSGRKGDV